MALWNKKSQSAIAVSRTNASLVPDGIIQGRGQVVAVLLDTELPTWFYYEYEEVVWLKELLRDFILPKNVML